MRNALALALLVLGLAIGCLPASKVEEAAGPTETTETTQAALGASVWTSFPDAALGTRSGVAIAHDASRGVTVIFGGAAIVTTNHDVLPTVPLAETREWNGKTWSLVQASGPSARVFAAMGYDAAKKVVLLYGGRGAYDVANNRPVVHADMWSYDGKAWTKLCDPCAPGPRESHAMAFDSKRNVTVLVGGTDRYWSNPGEEAYPIDKPIQTFSNAAMTSTWEWNGTAWVERCPSRSCADEPYGVSGGLVYDAKRDKTLYVGGRPFEWYCTGGVPTGTSCDSASNARRVPGNVREWNGTSWKILCEVDVTGFGGGAPLAGRKCGDLWDQRSGHGVVYDAVRERVVVYGGKTRRPGPDGVSATRGDVLELVFLPSGAAEWRSLCPANDTDCGPPRRHNAGVVFEPNRRQILVAGGARAELTGISYADTWGMKVRGEGCTSDATCSEGHCVDGVCCKVAACAPCETCSAYGREGDCTPIRGSDDLDSCQGNHTCAQVPRKGKDQKLRTCVGRVGASCDEDADCELGFCADHVCCNVRCDQSCDACVTARGAPSDGTCGLARAGEVGSPVCLGRKCTGTANTCEPDAACASDEDCEEGYECRADTKRCKQKVDCGQCAPYRCNPGGTCKARCDSVNDCAEGSVCDSNHRCGPLPSGEGASCIVSHVGDGGRSSWGLALALVAALVVARRGTARRERAR